MPTERMPGLSISSAPEWRDHQLAHRGRVPAALVVGTDLVRCLALPAQERVDEGRLADARRAEQGDRLARLEQGRQRLDADAVAGADGAHGHARRDCRHLGDAAGNVRAQVGLVEHDDRLGAARPGQGQVALEPAQVEVVVERR